MSPGIRSTILAIVCGMMAASFLHVRGVVDLSFGFPPGGVAEGGMMALIGGIGGYAILLASRILRKLIKRSK